MTNKEKILWVLKNIVPEPFSCAMTCARICREIRTHFLEEDNPTTNKQLNASISSSLRKMWKAELILSNGPIGPMGGRAYRLNERLK